jgi:purine-binding chemotaxis protein CheW
VPEPELLNVPRQLVIFRVAATQYGVAIEDVEEILPPQTVTRLPGAPNGVLGVADVRGQIVPVFDLHWKFGVPAPEDDANARFVLVRTYEGPVALLVDGVDEVVDCRREAFQSVRTPGQTAGLGYLNGVFRHAESLVLWVDPVRLVPTGLARAAQAA